MSNSAGELTLSIIIPTYNNLRLLERCLASLFQFKPPDSEVIIVDDASTDGTSVAVADRWPEVRLHTRRKNGGFCRAVNDGLRLAGGRIVELLNNDTEVTAGWAEKALAEFDDPSVGAVAPLVRRLPFRNRIDSAGDTYSFLGIARKRLEGQLWSTAATCREVFSASASSAFYRRQALTQVGGFPEEFDSYFDDVDLGYRLRLAGYRCLFLPESVVFHWVSQTHRTSSRRILHQISRNSESLFWSNVPRRTLAVFTAPHVAYVLCLLAYKAMKGEFGPWYAGKCESLAQAAKIWSRRRVAQSIASSAPQSHPVIDSTSYPLPLDYPPSKLIENRQLINF